MSYNTSDFPQYMRTAGKVTVLTAITGLLVFMVAFIFDVGTQELSKVSAQSASTTLTVLNTPPSFTLNPYEVTESSTSTPTNSDSDIVWSAIGDDANGADYYLLLCSTNASPTPNNSAAPDCGGGTQWGVSTSTTSGTLAVVSTTTTEVAPYAEIQNWFAWVCDGDAVDPRCIVIPEQGDFATSSSPFNVNSRPTLTDFYNDGPADPGAAFNFLSTSTDADAVGGADDLFIIVCNSNTDYNTTTNTCATDFLASTTVGVTSDATAIYTLPAVIRDDTYPAYGYLIDEHGHEASANPILYNFSVNNVAPTVISGDITLNGGSDITLSVVGGESTGYTLDYTARDANSCSDAASSSEMTNFTMSVFRSGVGSSTCDGTPGSYDPNNCYPSELATTTWNLSCSATTTCDTATQDQMEYSCTFPLWFVADPTDDGGSSPYKTENWSAAVSASDDNFATSTFSTTTLAVDLNSLNGIDILSADIAYGGIAPGDDSGTLTATSVMRSIGNTALDQDIRGQSMCGTYAVLNPCVPSATSTIPEDQQQFASTSVAYGSGTALASTTYQELELNISKTTSTSTPSTGTTYWGIAVPSAITLSGSYSGLNSYLAVTAETPDW